MHLGVDSFVSSVTDPASGRVVGPAERMAHLLEESALADEVGLYSFGIGEHHRPEYYDSAPPVILAAAAARTQRIRLGSAVAVLSAADPVRVFQQFATLDLISKGRIDLVVGRGSFTEAFPLFGLDLPTTTPSSARSSTCCCASGSPSTSPGPAGTVPP